MRIFLAADPDETVRHSLYEFTEQCRKIQNTGIKYEPADHLHLTLKFFGQINQEETRWLIESLNQLNTEVFDLELDHAGAFPNLFRPRILWAGFKDNSSLKRLHSEIEDLSFDLGHEWIRKEWVPHITFARIKKIIYKELTDHLRYYKDKYFGKFPVTRLNLYESKLSNDGPEYTVLESFPLKN